MSSRAVVRPSVPSSAHLHCQGLDIHRRMVTATADKYMQWLRKKIQQMMFKVRLVHRQSSSSSVPSSVLSIAPNVHLCHLLPIFTTRGWIFTDEWSQQQHQYFQRLSKATIWKERPENFANSLFWQKSKCCQRLCKKSCLWANQRGFLVVSLWIFGDGKKVVTIHWPYLSRPWWLLFWLAGKPLHRGSAEKHGWCVGPLAVARLRETQRSSLILFFCWYPMLN